jgi:hypothetical protein
LSGSTLRQIVVFVAAVFALYAGTAALPSADEPRGVHGPTLREAPADDR